MEQHVDLDGLTRKTRRLEFEDGLNDLQNALVFALLGLLGLFFFSPWGMEFYVRALVTNHDLTTVALIGLFALFILVTYGARRLIMSYRRRVLWKGRGDFEPLRWQVDSRTSVLATAVWLVVAIAGMVLFFSRSMDLEAGMRVIAAAAGLATGVIYYALGASLKVKRYRWVGGVAGLLSLGLMPLPISAAAAWLIFSLIWTLSLLIAGVIALRQKLAAVRQGEA
jgi:hypothetical protein